MRKRKFFSHHHTSESLYLIPTFNLSLAKQSECSRFFILFEILFPAFCKSKFLHIFGRFKHSVRKVKTFHFCHEVCHKLFPLLAALLFVSTMTESFLCLLNLPVYGGPLNAPYSADLFCCYVSLIRYIRPPSRHEYFPTFFAAFQNGAANHKAHCINAWADFLFSDPCSCYLILPADSPLSNGSRRPTLSKQTIFMRSFLIRSLYQLLKKLPSYRKNLSTLADLALPADPLCQPILTITLFSYFATRPIVPSQILRLLAPPIHPWKIIMTLATLGSFPFANHDLFPLCFLF